MARRVLTHTGMNPSCFIRVRWVVLGLVGWGWCAGAALAVEPEAVATSSNEPAWLSHAENSEATSAGQYQRATFRSMGVLLLLIGAMLAINYGLRRRFVARQPLAGSSLKVHARLRLGVRQEVVVVEWGGDQMVLGVGPSFIQPLHIRRGCPAPTEESLVVGGAHVQP